MTFRSHPPAKCCVESFEKNTQRAQMKFEWRQVNDVRSTCCCLLLSAATSATAQQVTSVDSSELRGMRYRMIGPSRGGRVTTVTGVPQEPMTFYMGSTGGGVWKTTNAGI